jgi:hypothetical protein
MFFSAPLFVYFSLILSLFHSVSSYFVALFSVYVSFTFPFFFFFYLLVHFSPDPSIKRWRAISLPLICPIWRDRKKWRFDQGCQMAYFQTKDPNFGNFLRVLQWKMLVFFYGHLVYFTDIWSILQTFSLFYSHLVYFIEIWYILW